MLYSACLRGLVDWYKQHTAAAAIGSATTNTAAATAAAVPLSTHQLPLVVNTDGWVKGLGQELLGAVIDVVAPAHILQVSWALYMYTCTVLLRTNITQEFVLRAIAVQKWQL
jgi:mRNA cleavage and polyadenylation factor CLP1 P-loop